jgi:CHASE2 domain-containing sensor protein
MKRFLMLVVSFLIVCAGLAIIGLSHLRQHGTIGSIAVLLIFFTSIYLGMTFYKKFSA